MKSEKIEKQFLGIPIIAYVETILFLSLVVFLSYMWGDGKRFVDYYLHPFWIIILLISIQHGTLAGIMSVILSTLFLYVGNVPPQNAQESTFEYQFHLAFLPLLWFVTAFILGEIRRGEIQETEELKHNFAKSTEEAKAITDAYQDLKKIKESLETQLGSQLRTSAMIYQTFKSLGTLHPGLVLMNLNQIVEPILNPKKYSIYALGTNGFESTLCKGWNEEEAYLRRFSQDHPLYQQIAGKQKMVCVINADDEKILAGEGILAAPLIDPDTGEVFGMLKIEEIDFLELNFSNLEIFKTACELIGRAYSNAKEHKRAENNAIYDPETELFSYNFFQMQKKYFMDLAEEMKAPLSMINLHDSNLSQYNAVEIANVKAILQKVLPKTAMTFHGKRKQFELFILLPAEDTAKAEETAKAFIAATKENEFLNKKNLVYKVEGLCEAIAVQ